jgi:hypothetical protein
MTLDKEPRIFADEDYRDSLGRYSSLFPEPAPVRGESSVVYSEHPCWDGAPARIRAEIPDARFVYVVGDPVDRTVRHYVQLVSDGKESRPLAEALADLEQDYYYNRIVAPSRYGTQVRQYLEHFDASRLLVVDQEDLRHRRDATMARIFDFLGVDPTFRGAGFDELHNTQAVRRRPTRLGRLSQIRALGSLRRVPFTDSMRARVRRLMYTSVERPALDPALRSRLAEVLREEAAWLREFSGQDFPTWSL